MEFPDAPRSAAAATSLGAAAAASSAFAGWDGKVGVDATPAAAPVALSPGASSADNQIGAGWATISLPSLPAAWEKASIDARINPPDQAAVGIKLKQPVANVGDFRLTIGEQLLGQPALRRRRASQVARAPNSRHHADTLAELAGRQRAAPGHR